MVEVVQVFWVEAAAGDVDFDWDLYTETVSRMAPRNEKHWATASVPVTPIASSSSLPENTAMTLPAV